MPAKRKFVANEEEKYEYINRSGEIHFISYTDNRGDSIPIRLTPNKTVWLTDDDIRRYHNDPRFADGKIVPVNANNPNITLTEGQNVMSDVQVSLFIKNFETALSLYNRTTKITSVTTFARLRDECIKQDKPHSFVKMLDKRIVDLQEKHEKNIML